jgi:hypothetical protein
MSTQQMMESFIVLKMLWQPTGLSRAGFGRPQQQQQHHHHHHHHLLQHHSSTNTPSSRHLQHLSHQYKQQPTPLQPSHLRLL